jgi:WD40 repeat protein/mono/diheme cytochrome c family protein
MLWKPSDLDSLLKRVRLRIAPLALAIAPLAFAQAPPTFKQVAAILQANCLACHNSTMKMGGLVMESYPLLMAGGKDGKVVVPGKPQESAMMGRLEGRIQPQMPLNGKLGDADIETIRRWILAGAPGPADATATISGPTLPVIRPRQEGPSPITALAFAPVSAIAGVRGPLLAIGGYQEVKLVDAAGRTVEDLKGHTEYVRAIAFSPDGKWLVAAGGLPARAGEMRIWDVASGRLLRVIHGHTDCIYAVAVSPDGKLIASSSYDKLIKLWNPQTGEEIRTLKDHVDAVFAIAFSPDGRRLASGSADRSVKIWDVATGERLYTLGDPTDVVTTVAFRPDGRQVAAAGEDKLVRTWDIGEKSGSLAQAMIVSDDTVLQIAYSRDGRSIFAGCADRSIKVLDASTLYPQRIIGDQPDWVQTLAVSPNSSLLAAGRYDGSVTVYDLSSWKPVIASLVAFAPGEAASAQSATAPVGISASVTTQKASGHK